MDQTRILNGRWNVQIYDKAKMDQMSGGKVEYDKWHHHAFTWKEMTADLYVDGVKQERPEGPMLHIKPLEVVDNNEPQIFLGTHHYSRQALSRPDQWSPLLWALPDGRRCRRTVPEEM